MTKLFATAAFAAALALPMAANALTVNFYDTAVGGTPVTTITDEGVGDGATGTAGVLTAVQIGVGGYMFSGTFSATSDFPPVDSMSSTFTVGAGGPDASARIEVTHFFDNGVPTPLDGLGSAVNNLFSFVGSSVVTEVFIGATAFGTDILVSSTSGSVSTDSGTATLLSSPYYITQIFTIEGANNSIGTATAEWTVPAPVPVPAAGGLLLATMLAGGIAARRKKKAA